ncbi:Splicing factor U2AF 35 kDa subunit [Toxocara canis]|uniref:Splicing factor U2AF 35 kDa subunit n=1 Tax=Toxocara canis TaxID=6265 RepID=A0A0B2V3C4_TOXCA|nr:Splicing factor U2AF 35 kDa subunit [Toxocara canis]
MSDDTNTEVSSLFSSEKDRVNCSFYFKIGACRHGDKCSRLHVRPTYSQTILLKNFYRGAALSSPEISKEEAQRQFDEFYREVYTEIDDEYGRIEEMNVCDNVGEHMLGNVYIKFRHESSAERAVDSLNERWFDGRPIHCELSPVLDFRDACCRQYEIGSDESSWSEPDVVPATEDRSSTPLAFRADRYPSDVSESESEPDPEIEAHKQMMRRQRWEELRDKLHIHQSWDEDREQNFVFSLL